MQPRLDSHHHLWDTNELRYERFDNVPKLQRPFLVDEYEFESAPLGVAKSICVEAASAGADGRRETEWLLDHVRERSTIRGIVAWAPLERSDVGLHLDWLLGHGGTRIVGVRRSFEFEDDGFPGRPDVAAGAREAGSRGLVVDVVLFARSLRAVIRLVDRCPNTRFVLDHLGKPQIRARRQEPWASELAELASRPNVACKLSGLTTEGDHEHWVVDDLRPYVEHALSVFGADRILYGSDWPIVELAGGVRRWFAAVEKLLDPLPAGARTAIFRDNAERIYEV